MPPYDRVTRWRNATATCDRRAPVVPTCLDTFYYGRKTRADYVCPAHVKVPFPRRFTKLLDVACTSVSKKYDSECYGRRVKYVFSSIRKTSRHFSFWRTRITEIESGPAQHKSERDELGAARLEPRTLRPHKEIIVCRHIYYFW